MKHVVKYDVYLDPLLMGSICVIKSTLLRGNRFQVNKYFGAPPRKRLFWPAQPKLSIVEDDEIVECAEQATSDLNTPGCLRGGGTTPGTAAASGGGTTPPPLEFWLLLLQPGGATPLIMMNHKS